MAHAIDAMIASWESQPKDPQYRDAYAVVSAMLRWLQSQECSPDQIAQACVAVTVLAIAHSSPTTEAYETAVRGVIDVFMRSVVQANGSNKT